MSFDLSIKIRERLAELNYLSAQQAFWDNQERAQELQAQLEQGQASSSEQDGSSSQQQQQLAEQLRTENDMLVQRCGQLVGEVSLAPSAARNQRACAEI